MVLIYIVIRTKGVSPASDSSWYTETQLRILLHFHTDLKHTHTLSLSMITLTIQYIDISRKIKGESFLDLKCQLR